MDNLKYYLEKLSADLFLLLNDTESIRLFIHSEESQFIRFTQSKVRQNTTVHQHELTLDYQKDQREINFTLNLTLDHQTDLSNILKELTLCRRQLPLIDINPKFVSMTNNGISFSEKKIERPSDTEMLKIITTSFKDSDMAGLYCSGPVRQISINSKGQFHFFESDFFFLDYSVYNGPKAAKGFYATDKWSEQCFLENIAQTKLKLEQLNKPVIQIPKGQYRAYLEPMALQEILTTLNWGGFSLAAMNQGRSALKRLHQNEVQLSEKFSMSENLALGYVPLFNSLGEISPKELPLIKNGKLANLLTSTTSGKEYNITSNYADTSEMFRSAEVKPGTLSKSDLLKKLDTGLYLSNLHYINWSDQQSARITGMTRYACFWVEKGEIKGPIQDLRFDDSIYSLLGSNLIDLTSHQELFIESATYQKRYLGATKVPGALIENFNFTL